MSPQEIYYQNAANTIIRNLSKRQMKGYYCATKKEALEMILSLIPESSSIGWGGSMSLIEAGVLDAVKKGPYEIFDRETAKTPEEQKKMFANICTANTFLMSTNAITMDGELVNIDGRGNRVSFLIFGPEQVIVLAGMNKVVKDVDSALKRIQTVASPKNTVRLNKNTPCSKTGVCADCQSPDCICCQTVITRRSGTPDRIKVILVGEELGY